MSTSNVCDERFPAVPASSTNARTFATRNAAGTSGGSARVFTKKRPCAPNAYLPLLISSVNTIPGESACTPTDGAVSFTSPARVFVSCAIPAFVWPYAAYFCVAPPSEPAPNMLNTCPPLACSAISRIALRQHSSVPNEFVSTISRSVSGSASARFSYTYPFAPALLIQMSTPPICSDANAVSASTDSARRASAAVAETLRETLDELRGTLERQVAATRGVADDVAAADERRSAFRDDVLSRLDAHAAALEAATAAEASRRAAAEAAHEADEATFATLCETAAASTRDAAARARDAADVMEAMASDVRFTRNEVESQSSKLANESNDRDLTVREARAAYEAEIDKASAVEAARNPTPEARPNDPDFAFRQQKPTADAPVVRVALSFPGAESSAFSAAEEEAEEEAEEARAAAEAARAAIVLAAKAEADAHARARAAAEADAREAARMLRERAADLAAARAEIHMLRAALRRRGDAGAGVPPGLENDEDTLAEDTLAEKAAKTPRVMDEDREDAASENVREERVDVLREEKEADEASEADEPRVTDAASSEDADASAALLDASAAARARLETMLRGAEAYAAPER